MTDRASLVAGPGPADHPPYVSVVIPTYNERDNVDELLRRLAEVLAGTAAEIILVDDSTDGTAEMVEAAARRCPVPVLAHHREQPLAGPGGAVVEGIRLAQGAWVVVMDADLQHPPPVLAELVAAGERDRASLVVASRYADGGGRTGLAGAYRRAVSAASTLLTRLLFRRDLAGVSDPMSGFFAFRAALVDPDQLQPSGYKILLELVVRTRPDRITEVPYTFADRFAGKSKSSVREGLRFLRHLAVLRLGRTRARMLGYGVIGLSGVLPNLVTLWLLCTGLGVHYLPAAIVATQVAIAWNFTLTDLLLFRRSPRRHALPARLGRFVALNNADLLVRIPLLAALIDLLHLNVLVANLATLVAAFLVRFVVIDRVIYVPAPEPPVAEAP
ncbi:glycosyltransferase [Plantactinospora sp. WMMB782]|uniref:glycosyltransferase n=1 Tax=Plantactinospora sp. WMMB782 TaxID=3404121 RepID=UPI003B94D63E